MLLACSWPMRWNTRSAPERSTLTAMPLYFASNALATFSASGRSTEVYQTTLPSFCAALTRAGVVALGGGAAALIGDAYTVKASALDPLRTWRLDNFLSRIATSSLRVVGFARRDCH